jgi:hypothetical protein
MVHRMFLAGIPVRSELILELAGTVDDDDLGQKLRTALANEITLLGLDVPERETILRALEDCPEELGELRATTATGACLAAARRPRLAQLASTFLREQRPHRVGARDDSRLRWARPGGQVDTPVPTGRYSPTS